MIYSDNKTNQISQQDRKTRQLYGAFRGEMDFLLCKSSNFYKFNGINYGNMIAEAGN